MFGFHRKQGDGIGRIKAYLGKYGRINPHAAYLAAKKEWARR